MRLLLIGILILISALSIAGIGCGDDATLDAETNAYLVRMESWHDKWDATYQDAGKPQYRPLYDALLWELDSIEPPLAMSREHEEYVHAHHQYVEVKRHMHLIQKAEERRFLAEGWTDTPDCEMRRYMSVSGEYDTACRVLWYATGELVRVRVDMWWVFRDVLKSE